MPIICTDPIDRSLQNEVNECALFFDSDINNPPDVCASASINFWWFWTESSNSICLEKKSRLRLVPPGKAPFLANLLRGIDFLHHLSQCINFYLNKDDLDYSVCK